MTSVHKFLIFGLLLFPGVVFYVLLLFTPQAYLALPSTVQSTLFWAVVVTIPLVPMLLVRFAVGQIYLRNDPLGLTDAVHCGFIVSFVVAIPFYIYCLMTALPSRLAIDNFLHWHAQLGLFGGWQLYGLLAAVIAYGIGWSVMTLYVSLRGYRRTTLERKTVTSLYNVLAVGILVGIPVGGALLANHQAVDHVARSWDSSEEALRDVYRSTWAKYDVDLLQALARNPQSPPDILVPLSKHPSRQIRVPVAQNRSTPVETLRRLSNDEDSSVRWGLAINPNLPIDILYQFSAEDSPSLLAGVAANRHAPVDLIRRLSQHESAWVRHKVALNGSAPPDILIALSTDSEVMVRQSVAQNSKTPPDALTQLFTDASPSVRRHVAQNSSTPTDIVRKLTNDPDKHVRSWAGISLRQRGVK